MSPSAQCFEDLRVKQDASGKFVCMYFHALDKCLKEDKCGYSHAPELAFTKPQKEKIAKELEIKRKARKTRKTLPKGRKRQRR